MSQDSLVSKTELVKEFKSKSRLFTFVPIEGSFDIQLNGGSSFESRRFHLDFSDRRSITSKAGLAAAGDCADYADIYL